MLLRDEKVLLLLNTFRGIVFELAFLTLHILLVVQHAHVLVEILCAREIEVNHIGAALRQNGIIVCILDTQHFEKERKDELALGVAGGAVEERVLSDDFSDASLLRILKAGEGIAYIATILEGQRLILRLELFQTSLQFLAFRVQLKIVLLLSCLDFGLLSPFAGRLLLV